MLTYIKLQNFKCFRSLALPMAPLTLLTGFNAAGKSTAFQSLLLIAQTLRQNRNSDQLLLNGQLVKLGRPSEIINSTGDFTHSDISPSQISNEVAFAVSNDKVDLEWAMQADDRSNGMTIPIRRVKIKQSGILKEHQDFETLESLLPHCNESEVKSLVRKLRDLVFLSAIRFGVTDTFPSPEDSFPIWADVGTQGEFAPWWFHRENDTNIDELRCHPSDKDAPILRRQFNAWANVFFPGTQANTNLIEKTNLVRLELRLGKTGDYRRPANIGYGLTYAFPIIVAGLLAKPGQILVIDSPEAHLHPLGQSQMGSFLAHVAAAGVQVIVETHSDHVLNGIRLGVKSQVLAPSKVAIHFFNHANGLETDISRVISPLVDNQGNLSEWPAGFFDQAENDLAQLMGWTSACSGL